MMHKRVSASSWTEVRDCGDHKYIGKTKSEGFINKRNKAMIPAQYKDISWGSMEV